jgi:hypothetical protein
LYQCVPLASVVRSFSSVTRCEELQDQSTPVRAHRQADGDLLPARARTRQQQVGDVAAGDEQHEGDHAHSQAAREHELLPERRGKCRLRERPQRERPSAVVRGKALGQGTADAVDLRLCLLERRPILEAAERLIDETASRVVAFGAEPGEHFAIHRERHPQIGTTDRERAAKAFGGHADHVEALSVERQGLAHDARVGAEAAHPQAV